MTRLLTILIAFCSSNVFARLATLEEAPILKLEDETFYIEKDGSYRHEVKNTIKILNERGRAQVATQSFDYSPEISSVKVVAAKTVNSFGETLVTNDQISDKPIAADHSAFDSRNRVTVAFPKAVVGSLLHLSTVEEVKNGPFGRNFFCKSTSFPFPTLKGTRIHFHSRIPLHIESNRPDLFNITQTTSGDIQTTEIVFENHVYTQVMEEEFGGLPSDSTPQFFVSSAESWDEVFGDIARAYQEKAAQTLPREFQDILDKATKEDHFFSQAELIMAQLANRIRYMADFRTIEGRLVARDLAEIAQSGYGDCKDYSILTMVMLRELGYDADIAFVERTKGVPLRLPKNPNPNIFNHAIVHVKLNEKSYWLDPTNPTAQSRYARADIANREALVFSNGKIDLQFICINAPEDGLITKRTSYHFKSDGIARLIAETEYSGTEATEMRDDILHLSRQAATHKFLNMRAHNHVVHAINKIDIPEIHSRLPGNFAWSLDIDYEVPILTTSMGRGFAIESILNFLFRVNTGTYTTGVRLGLPSIMNETILLKDVKLRGPNADCSVVSPWVTFERCVGQDKGDRDIKVQRNTKILKREVTNQELKTDEFAKFQRELKACDSEYVIIFDS